MESYFKQLCHIQGQLEDVARSDFEEIFLVAKAEIMGLLNKIRGYMQLDQTLFNDSVSRTPHHIRLPSLKLPKFDGKYGDYKRFITKFYNMVHENSSITGVDRFNYLLISLLGPALTVMEPFQNKVIMFLEHIYKLFNITSMYKGDSNSIRNIIDTVAAIRGLLLSLGPRTTRRNSWFHLVVFTIAFALIVFINLLY